MGFQGASTSAAMARAERALGTVSEGILLEKRVPGTTSPEVQKMQQEMENMKKAYEALERKFNENNRNVETYLREKSVTDQNIERLKTDLRNQYKNAQIKPLQLELAELKIKYDRLKKEGPGK